MYFVATNSIKMSSESVKETTKVPRSSESFKLEFKKIRRKSLVVSSSHVLVCFILLFLVQSSQGVCVWEGSGGFKLACGFRQSGLFRIRSLGGLKGWAGAGFTVGDEDGFKDSLTNAESRKQHTARQQQLKQQQPFWAQQPAQQQQANPLFSSNSASNQVPNFKLFALGSNINEQQESALTQLASEVNRNGLQKRSSYWKWPMGLRGQNRNSPQRQGVPVPGPVSMQAVAAGGPMGQPQQRRRKIARGRNPNAPANRPGGMQQYRPLMHGQVPQVPMMMPSASQPGMPLDAQQYQNQPRRQGIPFGVPGDQSGTIPYGLKLLEGSHNYGTKFLVGQFMNGQNSGLDTGDQDEGFAVADETKVGYDTNIFPDIYFTTTTPKDKLVLPDPRESEGTRPKTKLKKVRVIKNRGKDTKKGKKKVVVEATSQEPSEESASISQETTTKQSKPTKPTSAEEVTERITSTTIRQIISNEDDQDPMDVSSWPDLAANLPDDDERVKMFKLLQSMGFKAPPPAAFPMPRTTPIVTTTTTTTTPAPVRNPLNPLITKGYDPRFPPDHPINKAILESLTTTTTTTTPKPFYNQNGFYDPQTHFNKKTEEWTGVAPQHEKVGYVELGSHETKNRMSQTKLYNNKFYDHYNKSSIQNFGVKPKVTDIYWLHAATTQSSLFPIPAVEPTSWTGVKDNADQELQQPSSPAPSADEAFENFPDESEDWPEVMRLPSQNSLHEWSEYSKDDRLGIAATSENDNEQSAEDAPQVSSTPAPEPARTTEEPKQSSEERKPPRRVMIRRRFRTTTTTTTTPAPATTEAETQQPKRRGHRRRYKVRTTTEPPTTTTTSTTTARTTTTTTTTPRVITAVDTSYSWASSDGQQYETQEESEEQLPIDQNDLVQTVQASEVPEDTVEVVRNPEPQVSIQNEESSEDAGVVSSHDAQSFPNFYNHVETVQNRPQQFEHPQVIMPVEESEGDEALDDEEPVKFYQVPHSQALKPGLPVEDAVEEEEEEDNVNSARPNNLVAQQEESAEDQVSPPQQQPETRKKQKKPTGLTKPGTQMVAPPPGQYDQTYIYDHKDQPAGDFVAPLNGFQQQPPHQSYVFSTLGHANSQLPQQNFAPPVLPAQDEQIVKQHADPFNLTQNAVPSQGMLPPPPSHYQMFGSYQEPQHHQPTFPSVSRPRPGGFKFPTIPLATLNPFTAFQKPQHPKHNHYGHGPHGHFGGFQRPPQGLPQPSPSGHTIQFQPPPPGTPQLHSHHQFMQPPQNWIPKPPQHQAHNNNPYFQLTQQQHQALLHPIHSIPAGIPQLQHQQRHYQQQPPQISEKMDKPDSDKETILKALEALSKVKPDLIETIVKEKLGGKQPTMPTKPAVPQQVTVSKVLPPSPPPPKTEVKRVDTVSLSTDAISSLFGEDEEEEVVEDEEPEKDAFQVQMEKLLKLKHAKEILMKQKQEEWDREQQLVVQMKKQIEQVKLKEQLAAAAATPKPTQSPVSPEFDIKQKLASMLQQPNRNYTASQMETIKKILMLNHLEKTLKTKPSVSPPIGSEAMNVIAPPSPNLVNQLQFDALKRRLAQVNAQRLQPHMFSQRSDEADQAPNQIEEIPQPPEPTPESTVRDFQNALASMPTILALKALAMKQAQSVRPTPDVMLPQQVRPDQDGIVSATPAVDLSSILASPSPIQMNFPQETHSKWNEKPALTDVRNAPKSFYPGDSVLVVEFDNATTHYTDFTCEDQKHFPGLYADPDLSCQVFHLCAKTDQGFMRKSFRCPKATVFDQEVLRCNWGLYVDCPAAPTKYHFNKYLSESFQFLRVLGEFSSSYKAQKTE